MKKQKRLTPAFDDFPYAKMAAKYNLRADYVEGLNGKRELVVEGETEAIEKFLIDLDY
jgi:hypothetical protein